MYVPDCPSLSASQHIFTCRPYLMLFTKKLEIVSPLSLLMTEILWPKAIVSLLSLIFLNVSQLPSLQNLKVCALVHCTLETSTWAKAADGNVNAKKANEMCRNNLCLTIVFNSNFNLDAEVLIVRHTFIETTTMPRLQRVSPSFVMVSGARWGWWLPTKAPMPHPVLAMSISYGLWGHSQRARYVHQFEHHQILLVISGIWVSSE